MTWAYYALIKIIQNNSFLVAFLKSKLVSTTSTFRVEYVDAQDKVSFMYKLLSFFFEDFLRFFFKDFPICERSVSYG